ncbi:MAG: hypothetical protein H7245_21960 [Candidatus Saccharibacteria bacterium]|nr:hypothetical protein [Pseudorhodobacter sp.]
MLLLDSKTIEIDGITIFPDHADPLQFYYMPLAPHLTTVSAGQGAASPQFSLIRFKGAAGTGGFLNFDVNLGIAPDRLDHLKQRLQQQTGLNDPIRLGPLSVVDGTVRLIMLDAEDPPPRTPGTPAPTPAPVVADGLHFVEKISHAAKPSLYGDNQAAFSVKLTQEGVDIIEKSLGGQIQPIAVIYALDYLGLRPAYSVRLAIDWDRTQKHMDESFGVDTMFVSSDISSAVDKLIENRTIKLEVDSFVTDDDTTVAGRRDAAIAQVKAMMTDAFFTPSLPPWTPAAPSQWSQDLQKVGDVIGMIAAGPAASVMNKSLFSYKKTDYTRTDRKSLNVNLSERVTVKRSIFPQGHLAGMFEMFQQPGFDRSRFVIDVDLDNPWFKRRHLGVSTLIDFDSDHIGAINLRASYGTQPKNLILTKAAASGAFEWTSQLDGNTMKMPLDVSYDVTFTGVDATERPRSLTSAKRIELGEALVIDPRELYTISTVPVVATEMPWDTYPQVEVHLRYSDPANNLAETEVLRLDKVTQQGTWAMFVLDTTKRSFDYKLIYRAANHMDHETQWQTEDDGTVTVSDPFPRKRQVTIIAALTWADIDRCFIDLSYKDGVTGSTQDKSLELIEGDHSKSVTFELSDPTNQRVDYSGLILYKDGRTVDIPPSTTLSPRILIRADMKGHRLVQVVPPDLAAAHLVKITADLRYEDFATNLSFAESYIFEPGTPPKVFEYDYADPNRAQFEMRSSYVFDNGMQKQRDWQPMDQAVVALKAP